MANAILFLGWDRPYDVANEKAAYDWLMSEALPTLKKWEGKYYERSEIVALTPHAGDLNACIILFGERPKLDELRRTDEFEAFSMRMMRTFHRYGVVPGVNMEGMQAVMGRWAKAK
jgi:hypothetical protein